MVVLIEVERVPGTKTAPDNFVKATRESLSEIAGVIEETCDAFVSRVGALEARPSEIVIEFGVNASGEAGIPFITKGSVGANFTVSLTWGMSD